MAGLSELLAQNDQIAQQNNPNFAALNAAVLGRFAPYEGFGEFVQKTMEPFRQRTHTSQENLLDRQHQSSENALNRQHQSSENDLSRKHQSLENKLAHERTLARDAVLHTYNTARDNATHGRNIELNQKQHEYNKDLYKYKIDMEQQNQNDLRRLALEDRYIALGGTADPKTMDFLQLQRAVYSLANQPGSIQTMPDFKQIETTVPSSPDASSTVIQPNTGNNITVQDLPNLAKMYPNLLLTPEGQAFLKEVNEAYIANRENLQALQPLADRFNRGEIPLQLPISKHSYSYKVPKNINAVLKDKTFGALSMIIPDSWEEFFQNWAGSPEILEADLRKVGVAAPPIQDIQYDEGWKGDAQRAADNFNRNHELNKLYKAAVNAHRALGKMSAKQIEVSPRDNVLNEVRKSISKKLGIYDPEAVLAFIDGDGQYVFTVNGHIFRMNNGLIYEVKY